MNICGVEINPISRSALFAKLEEVVRSDAPRFHHGVTVNPEYIVEAQKNSTFRDVLNRADFTLVDGVGLLGAMKYQLEAQNSEFRTNAEKYIRLVVSCVDAGFLKQPVLIDEVKVERITGVDFVHDLVKQDWMKKKRVFLLGGQEGVAEKAADQLMRLNSSVTFGWSSGHRDIRSQFNIPVKDGAHVGNNQLPNSEDLHIIDYIIAFKPDVLLVAYGHPWQDLWIDRVKEQFPSVRLAMGVGGTFDYTAGEVARAPRWFQEIGLEWLYRLFSQPQRFGRVLDATWTFAQMVIQDKR